MKLETGNWNLGTGAWTRAAALVLAVLVVAGCGRREADSGTPLATVNDFTLTLESFEKELAAEIELDPQAKLTDEAKARFLEELIRKQVLIQEARRQGLDRQERFMRTIQRYWEATLIRNLLEQQGERISGRILIPEARIEERHRQLLAADPQTPPLAQVRDQILAELKDLQKTALLEAWIAQLKADSRIHIDQAKLKRP